LRTLGNVQIPSACNDQAYQAALENTVNQYITEHSYTELAKRYAINLASGRFLWRNRVGAEQINVVITQPKSAMNDEQQWQFNSYDFSLKAFDVTTPEITQLAAVIEQGLASGDYAFLQIQAFVKLGDGQEVFPSQELILDSSSGKDRKSKTLYVVNNIAAMHSQKIGNAIRTIDTWYPEAEELGPISVEPFGSVTNRGKAYRQPKQKLDFYTLLDNWVLKGEVPPVEQQHYVVANLIRGGVYGEKSE